MGSFHQTESDILASLDTFGNFEVRIFSDLEFFVHFRAILVEFSDRILVVLGLGYQNDFAEK
jgi:hypothetical protein